MDRQAIIEELRNIITEYLEARQIDLVDFIYRYEGPNLILRLLVDKPEGGISLGECALLNTEIGSILDEKDAVQQRYILEVSSPGLDRPLKTKNDFSRCIDKRLKIFLNEEINAGLELEGTVKRIEGDSVYIEINTEQIEIPLSKINKAKQVF
ncbi:MAG: ribosome maturation factor RimP [Candidatus Omnitrophica bacterium]|nr:ribosome maturation factor RimP [Candidatus Omnitrophota bacterium]MDD5238327.1 ribosome maturation factor RimP [Candidatus Omnitrophota bacterium]